jgi:group I intron endonuclease
MLFKDFDYATYKNGGIYKISNIINGRIYIGSTKCFDRRSKNHKYLLDNNKHKNKFLQSDYIKSGGENFIFEIMEFVDRFDKNLLFSTEQKYLNKFYDNQLNCYNFEPFAKYSRNGIKNKICRHGYIHSEETKEKRKRSLKIAWQDNNYLKENASKNALNKWNGYSADIIVSNIKTGESIKILGSVRSFCLERNIKYKSFNQMLNGRTKYSFDWFIGDVPPEYKSKNKKRKPISAEHKEKISKGKYKNYAITNKNGVKIILINNVKKHAHELKINYKSLLRVLRGEIKETSCGWRLLSEHLIDK